MAKFEPDDELIRRLAALLEETGLSEIEYESNGRRIKVGRHSVTTAAAAPAAPPAEAPRPSAPPETKAETDTVPTGAITAPMVGTVYVASEPGGDAFVKVGDTVREGQTLLIIEAMKVMNPLASPRAGTVTRILVSDGQPVEYGEPLIIVD